MNMGVIYSMNTAATAAMAMPARDPPTLAPAPVYELIGLLVAFGDAEYAAVPCATPGAEEAPTAPAAPVVVAAAAADGWQRAVVGDPLAPVEVTKLT